MGHNAFIRAGGVWSGSATVTTAEMAAFDLAQFQSVNGDLGGSWAPSSVITIGGSGLDVTGAFTAADCTGITLASGLIDVQSGAEIRLDNGATFLALSGATVQYACPVEITSSGSFILDGSVYPTFATPRTINRRGLRLRSQTTAGSNNTGGTWGASLDAWEAAGEMSGASPGGPVLVVTKLLTPVAGIGGNYYFWIDLPLPIHGATLSSVQLTTVSGTSATNTPSSWPGYQIERIDQAGNITTMVSGGAVVDIHQSGSPSWTVAAATTITPNQNNVIDLATYSYRILCYCPSSSGGSAMFITQAVASYSVPGMLL